MKYNITFGLPSSVRKQVSEFVDALSDSVWPRDGTAGNDAASPKVSLAFVTGQSKLKRVQPRLLIFRLCTRFN